MAQRVKTCAVFQVPSTDGEREYEVRFFADEATCTCKGWLASRLKDDPQWCKHILDVGRRYSAREMDDLTKPFAPNGFPAPLVRIPVVGGMRFTIMDSEFCFADEVVVEVRRP